MIVAPGSTSVSVDVQFLDDSGFAVTGKVAADFPACKWSGGGNTADTSITLSDLAAITTAHPNDNTAGGIKEREGGWYRLDLPNNMFTSAGRKTLTFAETTNKRIVAPNLDCQYTKVDVHSIAASTTAASNEALVYSTDFSANYDVANQIWRSEDTTSIAAIKAKTDSLTFTVSGKLDSNVLYVGYSVVQEVGGYLQTVPPNTKPVNWATDNTTSGTAAKAAIEAGTAGQTFKLSGGKFDFGSSRLLIPAGVTVIGSGMYDTWLASSYGGVFIRLATNSQIIDCGFLPGAANTQTMGCDGSDQFTDAMVVRCLWRNTTAHSAIGMTSSAASSLAVQDSFIEADDDTINLNLAAHRVTLINTPVNGIDDYFAQVTYSGASLICYGVDASHRPNGGSSKLLNIANGGIVEMYGGSLQPSESWHGITMVGSDSRFIGNFVQRVRGFDNLSGGAVTANIIDKYAPLRPGTDGRTALISSGGLTTDVNSSAINTNALASAVSAASVDGKIPAQIAMSGSKVWALNDEGDPIDAGGGGTAAQVNNAEPIIARTFQLGQRFDGVAEAIGTCRMVVGDKYPVWIETKKYGGRPLESASDATASAEGVTVDDAGVNSTLLVLPLTAVTAGSYTVTAIAHPRSADKIVCILNVEVTDPA